MKIVTQPKASHFIGGEYVEDTNGAPIDVIYPATGEVVARVHSATHEIVERAIASARAAQKEWEAMSGTERGRILRRAADIIRDRNHELSILETYDTGKPYQETSVADATSGADALEYFGGLAGSLTGEHIQLPGGDFVYTRREALGVCVGIGAWNYPTQIACWKGAPALACGNTMVFKPSETTPLCALKVAEILVEAGAPAGVYNVVQGYGDVGAALVTHAEVDKVSLTGSVPTGRKVYSAAAEGMKHVTMELGGKSPMIVFDDANVDDAVSGAILGNFYSTGQVCSNGTRVFVQKGIKEAFLKRLSERLENAVIGDPLDPETSFGPMVSEGQLNIVMNYIAKGKEEGARLTYGGDRIEGDGFFLQPTVFADVTDDMTIAREEIFGPVMAVLDFETEEEVMARANDTEFGLAAGVFTQDITRAHRVVAGFEAGTCFINSYNDAPVEAPFGGSKMSGVGRENSKAAINHYSELKTVYVRMSQIEAPF
ncbi:NAD/NADP-dependent betaine aldehyde dehydrogenase [Aliiroseovarius sp. xm-m-379]|uniref:betaine-aldehyde dehydrogenase n=1 Tax=unclassified Aliiroseovarius TaxID=2623558 RepID=UPI00156A506D|nr:MULTISPECIES: betaine-aldehyde dehydrogenase [unclassified Aliiroseovarius]NRP11263.1 NAD/NADP-dependent betaine aldehyde dehydrogenase [Aliiroseovarius sp. xm-d-517]NRP23761.1 NAD/NADP-dependent betaine aldehyde dehydrogenase [Aliiroseovarius sp. xm-m-379]NRP28993.1 NAD/NADP-dependent betaine aldehyde dehydrogenase [Aliiroseovarius sp. xm-m-314]NRP32560.1 NAD/NADP-dependent betaine aldehyde dehydrogenase [Aliiroseovarius sp. xm-a-104]NRP41093.1 NAD/NADP-dependent betaine aldehyde dehydroge